MSKTTQSTMLIHEPAAAIDPGDSENKEMTEETAAELREVCKQAGEPYDASLTELQAKKRIAALREMADLSN